METGHESKTEAATPISVTFCLEFRAEEWTIVELTEKFGFNSWLVIGSARRLREDAMFVLITTRSIESTLVNYFLQREVNRPVSRFHSFTDTPRSILYSTVAIASLCGQSIQWVRR